MSSKLLVLGGTSASLDVVRTAKEMGIYVIVADDQDKGIAKEFADEVAKISTTNFSELLRLISERNIDGVFCGPSEFNIRNVMKLCRLAKLPFYATKEQWDLCSNKGSFKRLCREYSVPCVPEFTISNIKEMDESQIQFPVIVKPVDGCSSKGISVCYSIQELYNAYNHALMYSESQNVIVEKYIENGGTITSVRYIADKGELYLSMTGDTYVVDPINRTALISALTVFPSRYTDMYTKEVDDKVKEMFKNIGFSNGVLFMQALTLGDKLYFHEMGLRLSGGLTYKITEQANGINDLKMMIRYALGGSILVDGECDKIDPYLNGRIAASFCIPLNIGTIASISGLDLIENKLNIESFTQYYFVGDTITNDKIGTLQQHFGRFKFFVENRNQLVEYINFIQDNLCIKGNGGEDMVYLKFNTSRIQ